MLKSIIANGIKFAESMQALWLWLNTDIVISEGGKTWVWAPSGIGSLMMFKQVDVPPVIFSPLGIILGSGLLIYLGWLLVRAII